MLFSLVFPTGFLSLYSLTPCTVIRNIQRKTSRLVAFEFHGRENSVGVSKSWLWSIQILSMPDCGGAVCG